MNDLIDERAVFNRLMHEDFGLFAKRAMRVLAPNLNLKWNWHLDLIADRLQRLAEGEIQRLIINVPPRSLKSLLCSVIYPAWLLGRSAHLEIVCISYAQQLGEDFSRQSRKLIDSEFYRACFATRLSREKRAVDQFETTAGGRRLTTSVGGTVTGRGGEFIILDDPMKPDEAASEVGRAAMNSWIRETLTSRPNDKRTARTLLVMQRLHEDDATAELMRTGGWTVICLPAIATEREEHHYRTALGHYSHVRDIGEALHPERENLDDLERVRAQMGALTFAAQYQQQPAPAEGNLFKRSWVNAYPVTDLLLPDMVVQSWDTASKTSDLNDYSVCTTWATKGPRIYLLDVFRERLEHPALLQKVIDHAARHKAERVLIEDKGSGTGLLQALRTHYFYNAVAILPKGDKLYRFVGITSMFEAGDVLLPEHAPWLDDYLYELCGFPSVKHDDQVDSTSQALHYLRELLTTPAILEYYRQRHEEQRAFAEDRIVKLRAPHGVNRFIDIEGISHPVGPDQIIYLSKRDAGTALRAQFQRVS